MWGYSNDICRLGQQRDSIGKTSVRIILTENDSRPQIFPVAAIHRFERVSHLSISYYITKNDRLSISSRLTLTAIFNHVCHIMSWLCGRNLWLIFFEKYLLFIMIAHIKVEAKMLLAPAAANEEHFLTVLFGAKLVIWGKRKVSDRLEFFGSRICVTSLVPCVTNHWLIDLSR